MKPQKKSSPETRVDSGRKEISIAKIGLVSAIVVAVVGMIGASLNAYFSSQAAQAPVRLPIQATQTAEARAMMQTAQANAIPISVTPTISGYQAPSPTSRIPAPTLPLAMTGCTPAPISELPPQSIAIIESLDGIEARVPLDTLRYEYQTGLNLGSGIFVEFKEMMSFELSNPNFTESFDADVMITFLDCRTHNDVIKSRSGSLLTGETEFGQLNLHILEVKRVDFQW